MSQMTLLVAYVAASPPGLLLKSSGGVFVWVRAGGGGLGVWGWGWSPNSCATRPAQPWPPIHGRPQR
jgi:hypothetical protein